ncbi:2447_t:CDS:2, partial [Funneliformis geosporum]
DHKYFNLVEIISNLIYKSGVTENTSFSITHILLSYFTAASINIYKNPQIEILQDKVFQNKTFQTEVPQDEASQNEVLQDKVSQNISQNEIPQDKVPQNDNKILQDNVLVDTIIYLENMSNKTS